jgi:hypothetical protein
LSERYYQADAATLAASLIPEPPRGYESGSDHFFRQSSRTLLESLLQVATPREPQSIPKLLELDRGKLKQAISGTPAYSLIDPGAHEQGAGIIATVANATRPFLYLPPADGRPSEVSTTAASHSRLKSSTMHRMRKRRPSLRVSETKSSDQRWLILIGSVIRTITLQSERLENPIALAA